MKYELQQGLFLLLQSTWWRNKDGWGTRMILCQRKRRISHARIWAHQEIETRTRGWVIGMQILVIRAWDVEVNQWFSRESSKYSPSKSPMEVRMKGKGKRSKHVKGILLREISSLCEILLSRLINIIAQVDKLKDLVCEDMEL